MGGKSSKKKQSCLVVGLDNSGKSTIVNRLKPEKKRNKEQAATVGFLVEQFTHGNVDFTMYDMSGAGKYRNFWEHFYKDAMGVIFVCDSADAVRMCVAKDELQILLEHKDMRRPVPILFFANKKDLARAKTPEEISEALELDSITDRPWSIVPSNALNGEGLEAGIQWLNSHMTETGGKTR